VAQDRTLPLGLPEGLLGALIGALSANNATASGEIRARIKVSSLPEGSALLHTYGITFRYVWPAAGAFALLALIEGSLSSPTLGRLSSQGSGVT
jgi:hypothetical protein